MNESPKPFLSTPDELRAERRDDGSRTHGKNRAGMVESGNNGPVDGRMRTRAVRPVDRGAADDELGGILQAGLNVSLDVPQSWEKPETLSTANLKDTVLTLPVGYTINPSAGSGLGVCTRAARSGNGCGAAGLWLPSGIEDRDRRSGNTGACGKARRRGLCRHTVSTTPVRFAARHCTSS